MSDQEQAAADLAAIDTLLTDGERAIRARVRAWVEEAGVDEGMLGHWEAASFPAELLPGSAAWGSPAARCTATGAPDGARRGTASRWLSWRGPPAASRPRSTCGAGSR